MFLIVFVTLVVSIIGLYAQVLSLQATKVHNAQVGLMETMMTWHGAATDLALSSPPDNATGQGCSLTQFTAPSGYFTGCTPAQLVGTNAASLLPAGYSFTFESVAYKNAPNPLYVITFVHDTASPPHNDDPTKHLLLPAEGGAEVGYTMNDLREQFARSAPVYLSYGSITSSGVLTVPANALIGGAVVANLSYAVPQAIPVGSLAIISTAQ